MKPFQTILLFLNVIMNAENNGYSESLLRMSYANLFGNVAAFIPLGFFIPRLFRKMRRLLRTVLLAGCIILSVEVLQYYTSLGSCDIDDIMLNLLGVFIGYLIFKVLFPKRR